MLVQTQMNEKETDDSGRFKHAMTGHVPGTAIHGCCKHSSAVRRRWKKGGKEI